MHDFTHPQNSPISSNINKERTVAGFRQKVWEHWYHGTGVCGSCPIRCENQGFDPLFGLGSYDADLMIVANEPGAVPDFSEEDGGGRLMKNMPSNKATERNIPHLVELQGYDFKAFNNWDSDSKNPLMRSAHRLFEKRLFNDGVENPNTVPFELQDCYYTNSLKCSQLADSADVENPSNGSGESPYVA